jgi:hypothetical protein
MEKDLKFVEEVNGVITCAELHTFNRAEYEQLLQKKSALENTKSQYQTEVEKLDDDIAALDVKIAEFEVVIKLADAAKPSDDGSGGGDPTGIL